MTTTWRGRRVLVTGASSGIGAALARELAAAGAVVAMCARRSNLLDDVLADCRRSASECKAWTIDLTEMLERSSGQVLTVSRVEWASIDDT
jgi:short-subunit dehydrogenase